MASTQTNVAHALRSSPGRCALVDIAVVVKAPVAKRWANDGEDGAAVELLRKARHTKQLLHASTTMSACQ